MKKYIHIGYPKNFSTSLQRDYFSKHPEIFHLGIGINNNLGYRDSIIEKAFEVYLKTCKSFKYKEVEEDLVEYFSKVFNTVEEKYKVVGVSSEHISFAFTHDGLSSEEKAKRLKVIFGPDTKIIMIVRNQFELIKSLYRECVRVGFSGDFSKFIKLIYKYQDRNFIYDFRYDFVYELYTNLFGKENVKVLFFEDYKKEKNEMKQGDVNVQLFEDLNDFLELSNAPMELKHYNEAIPANKVLIKAKLNEQKQHDIGNHLLESAEKHRIKKYLEDDLGFFEEERKVYSDVLVKRELIERAFIDEKELELKYEADTLFIEELKEFYEKGNKRLENYLEQKLPKSYKSLIF